MLGVVCASLEAVLTLFLQGDARCLQVASGIFAGPAHDCPIDPLRWLIFARLLPVRTHEVPSDPFAMLAPAPALSGVCIMQVILTLIMHQNQHWP